jgi:pimeloyl-ACP methyl ester carboxylesterase
MAYFEMNGRRLYYEKHGEGKQTLLFLNGIMMSTASWQAFVAYFSKNYTLVLIDFFDQGQSDYLEGETYTQALQVEVVKEAIRQLSLEHVILMGISYGGEIAMQFAVHYGNLLDGLILANTTAYTDPQLKAIGDSWIYAASTGDGRIFFKATIPPIYSRSFYENNLSWLDAREAMFCENLKKRWYDGFVRLVKSAETHNATKILGQITCPVLIIGAEDDQITPVDCQEHLARLIPQAELVVISGSGHASMYEKPKSFALLIDGFARSFDATFNIL